MPPTTLDHTLQRFSTAEVCAPLLEKLGRALERVPGGRLRFMEVCGTHTVSIFRSGLRQLLPEGITHISGPGCPVCVTHGSEIAALLDLAGRDGVILASYGDLLRVPGPYAFSERFDSPASPASPSSLPPPAQPLAPATMAARPNSLKEAMALGARVEVVYSPLNALDLAARNPGCQVVLAGAGFETTAPASAAVLLAARESGLKNFSLLSLHKLAPPALRLLLGGEAGPKEPGASKAGPQFEALLLPGHVATVLGLEPFGFIAAEFGKSGVVGGFEAADILQSLLMLLQSQAEGRPALLNQYQRAVAAQGNPKARAIMEQVFTPVEALWRGLGAIPQSGLEPRPEFSAFNARLRFDLPAPNPARAEELEKQSGCRCGQVLTGLLTPPQCPLFGHACTPANPVGPCMVSSEGGCAAYYKYAI